ncbi:MAG: TM0106 family RecB-like putative nuclease [Nitrospinae bacterium]|nr:TM0106 family RecB-like putative nuclease [Nitrospinota bacterium]
MTTPITGTMLYDLVQCPHRPTMDLFGDPAKRDETNPFVQLLWEKGNAHEREVIDSLKLPIVDLSLYLGEEKEQRTLEAMKRGEPLIYSGRITADDLLGHPDILRRDGNGYVAGDIKAGAGEFGDGDNTKFKKHYGVQLALYTDILERLGLASSKHPFVWDIDSEEITYDLNEPQGIRNPWTMWEIYEKTLSQARRIAVQTEETYPAYSEVCKLCHWYTACLSDLEKSDDLTLIPELGRAKRDVMVDLIPTVSDLATANIDSYISGKKSSFQGIGSGTLRKFHDRAKLAKMKDACAYLTDAISLPRAETELFFDIEVDPTQGDFCYLHGFVERHGVDNSTERYVPFFAEAISDEEEERVFAEALRYIGDCQPCVVYYYSKYERTIWRKLQSKYPSVCTASDIEELFSISQSVDLYYDIVKKGTEWPTRDHSIKTLATFLGFRWRDSHPSGAASIEWFNHWIQTGDASDKQRILDYNEDDCVATRVLLDGIRTL